MKSSFPLRFPSSLSQGDLAWAAELGEQSLKLYLDLADRWGMGYALLHLGILRLFHGQSAAAQASLEEALSLFQELGELRGLAITQTFMGFTMLMLDQVERAKEFLLKSLAQQECIGDKLYLSLAFSGLAGVAVMERQAVRGARLLGAAEALREAINAHLPRASHKLQEFLATRMFAQLDQAFLPGGSLFQHAWAEGHAMTLQQALDYAVEGPAGRIS